jgi:hypothetical protein
MRCYSAFNEPFRFEESTCPIMHGDVVQIYGKAVNAHLIGIIHQTSLKRDMFTLVCCSWTKNCQVATTLLPCHLVTDKLHELIQKRIIMSDAPRLIIDDMVPFCKQLEWLTQTTNLEQFHFYYSHWVLKELGFGRDLRSIIVPLIFKKG